MGARATAAWDLASTATRHVLPRKHPDRLLKLYHLYRSDEEHDLVGMVRRFYRQDVELFGYEFPARNASLLPWAREVEAREK
jgi:hypothetical protein